MTDFHPACRKSLESWRRGSGAWYSTWAILYESLLASPGFGVLVATSRHPTVAAQVIREIPQVAGNLAHDAHTAILMREHGIRRIYTRDTDFHRFPFVECVDPVQERSDG